MSKVNDIARIESQTYNGIGVIKVFFHPTANLPASLAQIVAIAQTVIGGYPQGTVPPLILTRENVDVALEIFEEAIAASQ